MTPASSSTISTTQRCSCRASHTPRHLHRRCLVSIPLQHYPQTWWSWVAPGSQQVASPHHKAPASCSCSMVERGLAAGRCMLLVTAACAMLVGRSGQQLVAQLSSGHAASPSCYEWCRACGGPNSCPYNVLFRCYLVRTTLRMGRVRVTSVLGYKIG